MEHTAKTLDRIYRYVTKATDPEVWGVTKWANLAWPIINLAHYGEILTSGITETGWSSVEDLDRYLIEHFDDYCDFA